MADNKDRPIIIKRIKKVAGGSHGGSWKVAYADFVTAMMAFFLLMWLLATATTPQKAALQYYFKHFSIFDAGSGVMPVQQLPRQTNSDAASKERKSPSGEQMRAGSAGKDKSNFEKKQATEKELRKMIDLKLSEFKDQIQVDIVPEGVRINVMDKDGQPMFQSASAQFQGWSAQVLKTLAEEFRRLPNKVVIEGHTDATPFVGNTQITNWELSTQRSMAARRALEYYQVDRSRFSKIVGYADKQLLYADAPTDPRNRRISFILEFESAGENNMKAIDLLSNPE